MICLVGCIFDILCNLRNSYISVSYVDKGDDVVVVTSKGQSIRFKESDVREMGRGAAGVTGMRLDKGDKIIGADIVKKDFKNPELLIVMANGYGKKTDLKEYKVQKRAGSGIKTAQVTPKTGVVIASKVVVPTEEEAIELVVMSKQSQVIRVDIKEIPSLGRQTQGVRIMKLREGDGIASAVCL